MRCVDCPYSSRVLGQYWCDIWTKPKRISDTDAIKDVPCWKYERRHKKEVE